MLDLDIGMNDRLCEPLRLGRRARLRPRQGDEPRGARGRPRLRPLPRRRRRRHPYRTYPGTHPTKGAYFTRGTSANATPATPRGPDYVDNMERLLRKFDTAGARAAAGASRTPKKPTASARSISARPARRWTRRSTCWRGEGHRHLDTLRLRAFPFQTRRSRVHRRARPSSSSSRTATRRCARCSSTSSEIDPARLVPVLHYDGTPITARFIVARSRESCIRTTRRAAQGGGVMTYIAKPKLHHPGLPSNALGYTRATTRARSRRCAPAAGTIRSAPPSSRPASSSTCRRTGSPSSPASAARRRRRLLPRRSRTASTACTGACRRC
jgi:hypothetical protein